MSEEREVRKLTASILDRVESLVDERDAAVARADKAEKELALLKKKHAPVRCSEPHPTREGCECIRDAGHGYAHRNGTVDWHSEVCGHANYKGGACGLPMGHGGMHVGDNQDCWNA